MNEFILAVIVILIVWLFYSFPWTLGLTVGLIITGILIRFITKPNGNVIYKFYKAEALFDRILNPFRQMFGKMPIWIIPTYDYGDHYQNATPRYAGRENLDNAIRLWENIRDTLKELNWSYFQKKRILRQTYTICENIVIALWKLRSLEQTRIAIKEQFDKGGKSRQQVATLWRQVTGEIDNALEVLTLVSVHLTKLRMSGTSSISAETRNLIEQLESSNQELADIAQINNQRYVKSTSSSLWSYTFVLVVVVATFTISSRYVPDYAFAITVSGSLLGLLVIGVLKLRDNEKISESGFVRIIVEFLRSIGFSK